MQRTIHIKTFGCQMNVYDSDRMSSNLVKQGFVWESDLRKADVILINTCAIRDKSEHKVLSLLGELKPLKDKDPKKVIGVSGCVGQRLGRTLLQKVPHLDLVFGPDSVDRVGVLVDSVLTSGTRTVEAKLDDDKSRSYSQPVVVEQARPSEYLTVMKGCDHFCTYCIVPFVRGREKSRSVAEIVQDTKNLVARGTREIIFLGQNINTYGKGTGEDLSMLVAAANEIEDLYRIRYVTSHPRDLTEAMMEQFGKVLKLCPQLHLPFQAGSDRILKRMSRLYTRADYMGKVSRLRHHRPDIALTTDVIIGFPGETEEDFEQTMEVLREVDFAGVFLFKYSPRPGTRAYSYEDEVPETVKGERFMRAQEFFFNSCTRQNKAMVGRTVQCLIETMDKQGKYFTGRTPHNKVVHVLNAGQACVGKLLDVEIIEANATNLKGYYVGAPRFNRTQEALSASL